jgi:hypothetical protein
MNLARNPGVIAAGDASPSIAAGTWPVGEAKVSRIPERTLLEFAASKM